MSVFTPPILIFLISIHSSTVLALTKPEIELANRFNDAVNVSDYLVSEKLDGIRARWDGSRLLTRTGNPIFAPQWFTNGLPKHIFDGELWIARQRFEKTASVVLTHEPGDDWREVKFMLFDLPEFTGAFSERLRMLEVLVQQANLPHLQVIPQQKLHSKSALMQLLDQVIDGGGEGLMLHHEDALYTPSRSDNVLKLKKHQDAEAIVLAHLPGNGKYQGMMGSIRVQMSNGKVFKIGSGFSDQERLSPPPIGAVITFKYYDLTINGIPKFASYIRQKPSY
ncbi:ATP dependent DNA ligase [Paraglaciecola sp. T6c]|uniref:DNA ligase n=1 Tax=Pseudoalteromonas atlantica (strain T6c / ATCC BAA-1087) TaxID=3042615 RepID=UPI00005C53F5|nr:DNA ligase [Paraglaciecola sp. T6c]ABG38605.1 ATP dependent DNA ligase [Paraglaciecola sp. T6c]